MTRYMISFDDGDMTFPAEDLPDVASAAQAVDQAARRGRGMGLRGRAGAPGARAWWTTDGTVTDGPYPESKEHLGGFAVVDVASREAALEWAARIAVACRCAQQVFELLPDDDLRLSEGRIRVIDVREAITQAHNEEWARVVAALARRFGDLDIAEEATAEAFAIAVRRWPVDGVPPNPGAWLTTTAKRTAIDRIRREHKRDDKQREAQMSYDDQPAPLGAIDDDRLRLIFTCCHPALAMETRVALTLRMVGGLTMPEIARAFLVQEAAMGQRITRAKAKIKVARIPYRVPTAEDLPARVSGVLAVLFLVFNEGYLATGPDTDPVRQDLTAEAIRLTRLVRALMPEDGEVAGLLALMLLTEARRTARVSPSGELVTLDEQDRGAWDAALIAEGHRLVRERLASGVAPGRYQILAAINAVHTSARDVRDTDWSQVVALYDQLVRLDPSPIVALNRAIAVAELDGPEVALADDRSPRRQAGRLPRVSRHPRRPAAPAGPQSAVAGRVRPGHRAGGQHRRDGLPDTPPRPAGIVAVPGRQRGASRNVDRAASGDTTVFTMPGP